MTQPKDNVAYLRQWATDIRKHSGKSVDADRCDAMADEIERLRSLNAELVEALTGVRKIISEAAQTGFNYEDGDWAERLYASQQVTSAALTKAKGNGGETSPSEQAANTDSDAP